MNFSAILDISSFFIGMIINLLLIALICYYFKRKYENLEIAQNEQAKVLYQLLQQNSNSQPKVMNLKDILENVEVDVEGNSDSDSDSNSEFDDSELGKPIEISVPFTQVKKIVEPELINVDTKNITNITKIDNTKIDNTKMDITENDNTENVKLDIEGEILDLDKDSYSKMTIKQLKEILSVKGINSGKLKKNEMIELIEKSSVSIDEQSE